MYAVASSGGKDSTFALYRAQQSGFSVTHLFHIYNNDTTRVRFHGYKPEVVDAQAGLMGVDSIIVPTSSQEFDRDFKAALEDIKGRGLKGIIFGDIFLEDVREFYESRVRAVGLEYYDILWQQSTETIIREFIRCGFKAVITSVWLKKLEGKYLGRQIDRQFIAEMEKENADICGENGEYHSLVYDGPCFRKPLPYKVHGTHEEKDNIFLDVRLEDEESKIIK